MSINFIVSNIEKKINLLKAAKEFNIGLATAVEVLSKKGYRVDAKPNTKLSKEEYDVLQESFESDRLIREEARQIAIGRIRLDALSHEKATELLEECFKKKQTYLDLGRCGLSSKDFVQGTNLDKLLRKCVQLETLVLSNEWWQWEEGDKLWKKVKTINDGYRNSFNSIPPAVSKLPNLSTLICCGEIGDSWGISNLIPLRGLKNITHLDVRYNEIQSLRPLIYLPTICTLYLSGNRIKEIDSIDHLISLVHLDMHSNIIKDITPIAGLPLRILDIHQNEVRNLTCVRTLKELKMLFVSQNSIENIDEFQFILKYDNLYLEASDNPFISVNQLKLLKEENHYEFIREILLRTSDSSKKQLLKYPTKVLLLGNHASGKSSLVNYLTSHEEVGSTHVLRIANYHIDNHESNELLPDAIFFDFGGQDFYHGVYQMFISKDALQVILYSKKNNVNEITQDSNGYPIINFNLRYWLGQKKYQEFGSSESASFILVQSFSHILENYITDMNFLDYDGYKKSFSICLSSAEDRLYKESKEFYDIERNYFKAYLDDHLRRMQKANEEPTWYVNFLEYIFNKEDKDEAPKDINDVLEHYKAADLSPEDRKASLITNLITLHRHGLVLYYDSIEGLEDVVWLNPQKLVQFIQNTILSREIFNESKPGIISRKDFEKKVGDSKLLLLLQAQNIIFLHKPTNDSDSDEYIMPNYLPLATADNFELQLFTFGLNESNFTIRFNDFIPFGFINQMICFFGLQPDLKKFWRNKLLFTIENQIRVLIELDFESLSVSLKYHRLYKNLYSDTLIMEYLYFSIIALYWNVKTEEILSFSEFLKYTEDKNYLAVKAHRWELLKSSYEYISDDIFISIDSKRFVNYFELFQKSEDDFTIASYTFSGSNHLSFDSDVDVIAFKPFTDKKFQKMKKIFISYSKFDEEYLQDFEDHLITLKQEGIATFNCRQIDFGKEWDDEIKRQIDQCDIMVCLVSVKFLNTDYITRIEIPKAVEQNKMIIPIIIKSCDWENSVIGKYQAAQRGRIVSLDPDMALLGSIRGNTKEERDAFWTKIIKEFRQKILTEN